MTSSSIRFSGTVLDIELPEHEQDPPLTDQEIREKPWKYIGYRGYADFMSSDNDLLVLRRFNALNVRVILAQQDKLSELEHELAEVDKRNSKRDAPDVNNGTLRDDIEERKLLLRDIKEEIYHYNKMVLQQSRLCEYPTAPRSDVKNIKNWHFNHGYSAIAADEQEYLEHQNDLVCVTHKTKTPLRRVIDKSRRLRTLGIWRTKIEDPVPQYDSQYVSYYSDQRIDGFASGFIVLVGLTMLVTPIWVLNFVESMNSKLIVITIFTVFFLLVMSFAMVAKPFEALGATAAYAAVLMVFMQLGSD
ncbi:hypothetical protein BJ166DRAFT_512026 [Pestalotiopsis sp. NC0098]|nr:hypothetical protein BJ166DRAFT_512026 [Pestalotiopsis sp. NC0098]